MAQSRAAEIRAAAEAVLDELLADAVLTITISSHREIKRGRVLCGVCGTMCRSHAPLQTTANASASASSLLVPSSQSSRAPSPSRGGSSSASAPESRAAGYLVGPEKGTGGATGIGSGSGKLDASGNAFFECLVCRRSIASNRYAPHLSSCLGFTSSRRGASRLAAKARLGNGSGSVSGSVNGHDRSSPSPYVDGSQHGDSDEESLGSKKGRKNASLNGSKRGRSPNKAPAKRARPNNPTSLVPQPALPRANALLPPSRLGHSSTVAGSDSDSSPEPSVGSFANSQSSAGGVGGKTLPGVPGSVGGGKAGSGSGSGASGTTVPAPKADDGSSDEEVDDY